ncbi:MAG: hypothetical protein L3J74_04550 [Bacteroidales bacterium]|nr:hypothetical protein [Bacteroidales bacterium]
MKKLLKMIQFPKIHFKQTLSFIILLAGMLINQEFSFAQNERFHGGRGDGADVATTGIINFNSVDYEGNVFTVHIDKATGQADTTENTSINFKLTFSETVIDLRPESIVLSGDAQPQTVQITGGGTEYTIAVSGMLSNGHVIIDIPAGKVHNSVGSPNLPAVIVDNEVVFLGADLTVEIKRSLGQEYLTNKDTVRFDINFNESVINFDSTDVEISGTAMAQGIITEGDTDRYIAKVFGFQNDGNISINIPAGVTNSIYGKSNLSSINTENTVIIDRSRPDVEIKLADGQTNPAYTFPIKFKVVFSEDVVDFSGAVLMYGGSPNIKVTVSGNGSVYIVAIDSLISNETISIYLSEDAVHDYAGNGNTSPIYTNNSVTFKGVTGINQLNFNDYVKTYSNEGNLTIIFKDTPKYNILMEIYKITGQKVLYKYLENKTNTVKLLPLQTYIIRFSGKNIHFSKKIFVQ